MIVQIYEIQEPWEAERCIELGVDHIGSVILSEAEWKVPAIKEVIGLTHSAGKKNSIILLFQRIETILRAVDYYGPDMVHFCESLVNTKGETVDLSPFIKIQDILKKEFPDIQIMRSIPIAPKGFNPTPQSLSIARALEAVTDIFLTDTWLGKEPVEGYIGITGKPLDWDMAAALVRRSKIPVILAGGLSPENVYEALIKVAPVGADSCTGTNKRDQQGKPVRFRKDFDRVRRFVEEVRKAELQLKKSAMRI